MAEYSLAERERSGIYAIVNTVNGKRYVGSAKCFRTRWNGHRTALKKGRHHSRHLQAAWLKYGAEAFDFRIVEFCELLELIEREQAEIDRSLPAYNICRKAGSTLGRPHSAETRQKIGAKKVGLKLPPRSAEYRRAASLRNAGKQKSEAHAAAFQAGRAARVYTDEQKRQMSESLKAAYESGRRSREKSEEHRHKIGKFYAKLTDEEVKEIRDRRGAGETGRSLAIAFDSNPGTISEIVNRKRYCWVK